MLVGVLRMTPRLRELEAKNLDVSGNNYEFAEGITVGELAGYRMAMEDLKPVLEAARKTVTICVTDHAISSSLGGVAIHGKCLICPLRDALAGLEAIDAN